MMKYFTNILLIPILILFTASCTSDTVTVESASIKKKAEQSTLEQVESTDSTNSTKLSEAIALAKQNKDYRLLVTSGRSITIPGVNADNYQSVIALCGKKYNAETGDVITSETQRTVRKKRVDFMRQYNEKMLEICQNALANR